MSRAGIKRLGQVDKGLKAIYRKTLEEIGSKGDLFSLAITERERIRKSGYKTEERISSNKLELVFDRAMENTGPKFMVIQPALLALISQTGARHLAGRISREPTGEAMRDGFLYLVARGLLDEDRWKEAEETAGKCGDRKIRAAVLVMVARHLVKSGKAEQAEETLEKLVDNHREQGDPYASAMDLCRTAGRAADLGLRKKGSELAARAEAIDTQGWPGDRKASLLAARAKALCKLGKQAEAQGLAEEALRMIEGTPVEACVEGSVKQEDPAFEYVQALVTLGAVFSRLGCDSKVERCLELAGTGRLGQRFLKSCARACIKAGRLEKAAEHIEKIRPSSTRLGLKLEMAGFHRRHGMIRDAAKLLSDVWQESAKVSGERRQELERGISRERIRLGYAMWDRHEVEAAVSAVSKPVDRLWMAKFALNEYRKIIKGSSGLMVGKHI